MPAGFYELGGTASQIHTEKCRSCDGEGVIWSPPDEEEGVEERAEGKAA